jgi:probable rRNA maturation factor
MPKSAKKPPMPPLQLSLQFALDGPDQRHRKALPRHRVLRCIRHALQSPGEITVRIVDEAEGRSLNLSYRQRDYATNVLTFDYAASPVVVADLVLCAPVIAREARELGVTLADHYAHLLVHGTLHAQGWDHETSEADAEAMEAHETNILAGLGIADPYRRSKLRSRKLGSDPN